MIGTRLTETVLKMFDDGAQCVQFYNTWNSGTTGCIGTTAKVWVDVNGHSGAKDTQVT